MLTYFICNFQGSRNDEFSHITVIFGNMLFNKKDHIFIKNLYLLKGYTVKKQLKEF